MTTALRALRAGDLRSEVRLALKMTLGGTIAWWLAVELGAKRPIFAALVPLIAMTGDPFAAVSVSLSRIVGVFAKSEADPRGTVRGRRHTMLSDDDISDTRYSRCVLSAVLASVLGDTRVYVSTRAEHHGPLGGGPLHRIVVRHRL